MTIAAAVSNSGGSNASTTTHAVTAGVAYSVGNYIVVVVAADNTGASGADSITGVSDAQGNSYMRIANRLNDPGAAAAGVSLHMYMAKITTALASGDNITATYSPATTAKSMIIWRVTASAGHLLHLAEAGAVASTANPSQATASLNSGDLVIGAVGAESSGAVTGDSDTTGGSWTAATTAQSGGTMLATSQAKVTTASGAQTYNITLAAADRSISTVTFREVTLASKVETLTDDFTGTSINGTKWPSLSAGASQNDVGILATTAAGTETFGAAATYGFRDTFLSVEVKAWVADAGGEQYIVARKNGDGANYVAFIKVGDTLYYRSIRGGTNEDQTTSYSGLGSPLWFRLREASGQTYFDTSTDGTAWTTRRTIATNHMWGITDAEPLLTTFGGTTGQQWQFDNVNTAPAAGVTVNLTPATAASSAQAFTVTPGAATVASSPATAAAVAQAFTVAPGPVTVTLTSATATSAAQAMSASTTSPGVTVNLTPATAAATARPFTVTPGTANINMVTAVAAATAPTLPISAGPVTTNLTVATAAASARPLVISTVTTIALTPATSSATAQPLTIVPGAATVNLTPATAAATAQPLTPANVGQLTPAVAVATARPFTITTGPVVVNLTPATATAAAQPFTIGSVTAVNLTAATATSSARPFTVTAGAAVVQLTPAVAAASARPLAITTGPASVNLATAVATAIAVALGVAAPPPVVLAERTETRRPDPTSSINRPTPTTTLTRPTTITTIRRRADL